MLTLIACGALVAAIFIYNALRGIQQSLARLATHFAPELQTANRQAGPLATPAAWPVVQTAYAEPKAATQQRAQAEANAASRFRDAELERLAMLDRQNATAAREEAVRHEAVSREAARREGARLAEEARAEEERSAARATAAEQDAAARAAAEKKYAEEYAAYEKALAEHQAQQAAVQRAATGEAARRQQAPSSSAMWWTKPAPRVEAAGGDGAGEATPSPAGHFANAQAQAPEPASAPAPSPQRSAIDWEMFAGGRLFNIIGALTLIIGVGLLFKYAFDQNWIDEQWRVALGVIVGGVVVAVGHLTRGRSTNTWFGDGIVGTGLGTLYLSGYGAFQSYHLVPFGVAYGYMSLVTLVAFALALRYDSIGISLIGWAGGFLTPFIVSDGGENELGLASYLVVLDLGMAAIGIVKSRWFVMQPLAMGASYLGVLYWYSQNASHNSWFVSVIALLSLWFVFFASSVASTVRRETFSLLDAMLAAINGLVLIGYLEAAVGSHRDAFDVTMSIVATAYAMAYGIIALRLPAVVELRIQYAVATAIAMLVATFSHVHGYEIGGALALEAAAVLGIARAVRVRLGLGEARELLVTGFGLLGLGWFAGMWIVEVSGPRPWALGWGGMDATVSLLILTTLGIERLYASDNLLHGIANYGLRFLALVGAGSLVSAHADGPFGASACLALLALTLGWIGMRSRLVDLQAESIALLALAHTVFWSNPETYGLSRLAGYVPIANERFLTLALLSAVTAALGELARRYALFHPLFGRALRLIGALALTVGGTFEIHDGFRIAVAKLAHGAQTQDLVEATARLVNTEPLAIMALWIAVSVVMVGLGVALRVREFRIYAIAVFDITILKAFYDLHNLPNPYKIFAFMGLGIVLLGVSALYSRLEQGFFGKPGGSDRNAPKTADEATVAA